MAQPTEDDIIALANKYGLPPEAALAIYNQESSGGRNVKTSDKGAMGGFQLIPTTFASMNVGEDITDPMQNAEAGIKYLAEGYKKTGSIEGMAGYYHAGPAYARKLADNPNMGDGSIRTADYQRQVGANAKRIAMEKGFSAVSDTSPDESAGLNMRVADAPATGNTTPTLAGKPKVDVSQQLVDVMEQGQSAVKDLIVSSEQLGETLKDNIKGKMESLGKQGELKATIAREKFYHESQIASENAADLSRLGINTNDSSSIIAGIERDMVENYKQQRELRAKIEANREGASGFNLLDPIGSIVAGTTLTRDIRRHNALVRQNNADRDFIDGTTAAAEKVTKANLLRHTSISAQGAAAAADLAIEEANKNKIDAQDQLIRQDFDTKVRTLSGIEGNIRILQAADNAATNGAIKMEAAKQKQVRQALADSRDAKIKVASSVLGMDIPNELELKKQPKPVQDVVYRIFDGGLEGTIANSPLEASEMLNMPGTNLSKMDRSTAHMASTLDAIRKQEEKKIMANAETKSLPKERRRELLNSKMQEALDRAETNPNIEIPGGYDGSGKIANPYARPSIDIMTQDPNAQKLKLTAILQEHSKVLPNIPLTDSLIPALALEQVGTKYKDVGEAAKDMTEFYRSAIIRNNNTFRLDALGLPPQTQYRYEGKDLTKYNDVMKVLLRMKSDAEAQAFSASIHAMPGFAGVPN
jgi:hypothetical protein